MKESEKVEAGKRLAEWNRRKGEEYAHLAKAQSDPKLIYYGVGAIVATGALSVLCYHIYQSKKTHKETPVRQTNETTINQPKETPVHKFEME